ncbi:MAG: hypothetical protein HQL31_09635 [Planctomycetes bacterium]|nr:hypothetical protein [Planctomycetota bacterium]
MGILQKVVEKNNHVGAILTGRDAGLFEFISDHCGESRQQLKLIGKDGQMGLSGGPEPESEDFSLRFLGAKKSGSYEAILRIVTQAANMGVQSQANPGETPVNLYYVDLPIAVAVKI